MIRQFIQDLRDNPRKLFIVDGLGAVVTAFSLSVILVRFEHIFGIPPYMLYILAIFPVVYGLFDIYSFRSNESKWPKYLRVVAILNLSYCFISLAMAFYHAQSIRVWGWLYLINEIIVIVVLSIFELSVAQKMKSTLRNS